MAGFEGACEENTAKGGRLGASTHGVLVMSRISFLFVSRWTGRDLDNGVVRYAVDRLSY